MDCMNKKVLLNRLEVERKTPANLTKEDLFLFKNELTKIINEVLFIEEKNVVIVDGNLIFNSDGKLLKPFTPVFSIPEDNLSKIKFHIKNYLKRNENLTDNSYYWIIDAWSFGYFHWITDSLPRLLCIIKEIGPGIVLLPEFYKNGEYILKSLYALNCSAVFFNSSYKIKIRKLISCTQVAPTGNYNPEIIRKVSRSLIQMTLADEQSSIVNLNVYISREKAIKRKLKNENEIKEILLKYNFKFICFEDLAWVDQIKLMNKAKNVVSIHGAGLTNCMFMKEGGNVFELRGNNDDKNNCYFSLCSALNLNYYYQTCNYEIENLPNSNLIIDPVLFEKNLLKMLGNPD